MKKEVSCIFWNMRDVDVDEDEDERLEEVDLPDLAWEEAQEEA